MKEIISVFPLDNCPGTLIKRLARELDALLYRNFRAKGFVITPHQWAVLNRLWETEGLHQNRLAERTFKNKHNLANMLAVLEKWKLICRKPDPRDRRLQRIYLTKKGKALKDELIPIVVDTLKQAFTGLEEQDILRLRTIHEQILNNLIQVSVRR